MTLRIVSLIVVALNIGLINSCVRTSDTGVTTTTAATTGCMNGIACNPATLPRSDMPGASPHAPTITAGPNDANGCATVTVSCMPIDNNPTSLVNLYLPDGTDIGQAGDAGVGNPGTAPLVCNAMGQWTFTFMGLTTVIGSVQCFG